jgi:hypothetical protein
MELVSSMTMIDCNENLFLLHTITGSLNKILGIVKVLVCLVEVKNEIHSLLILTVVHRGSRTTKLELLIGPHRHVCRNL